MELPLLKKCGCARRFTNVALIWRLKLPGSAIKPTA